MLQQNKYSLILIQYNVLFKFTLFNTVIGILENIYQVIEFQLKI